MSETPTSSSKVFQILWQALDGGEYDLEKLQKTVDRTTDLGKVLDSLDMTDFVLRLENHYKISVAQEDYPRLTSIAAIEAYVQDRSPVLTA
jgi:acyl carrier protein